MLKMLKLILKNRLYNEHYPSILVTYFGGTEHFSGKIGALSWSILVGKQKHNVQKPIYRLYCYHGNLSPQEDDHDL